VHPSKTWPATRDQLLALDEIEHHVYLRHPEVRGAYPAGTMTHARDEHGQLWRAVDLEGIGVVRVRLA
jgi:hypothetical protein